MPKPVRLALAAIVAGVLLIAAFPWLSCAWYAARLSRMAVPVHLPMPVAGLHRKALNDTWQASRPPNRRHQGIDIFGKKGAPIVSATEGVVIKVGQDRLGGNVVMVYGPAGYQHYYAHLDQFADLHVGDRVQVGSPVGTLGNTGNAHTTPPHLHYGVYAPAGAINPYPLLTAVPPAP